jgi:NitT/TauT family transport system substrate-binding protein
MRIRIGHLSTFYHTAVLLMARKEIERQLDIDVDWQLFGTGPAIVNAFGKKELDIAYIGLPPAIIGIAHGVNIRCIAGGHVEGTVLSGNSDCKGFPLTDDLHEIFRQFQGHSIGVPGKGSIHDVILKEIIDRFGLAGKINVINFPWADEVTEAAAKGTVRAAMGTPALAAALKRYAGFRVLHPPSRIWPGNPSYGILTDKDFLEKEQKCAKGFLRLHEDATLFLRNHPSEAADVIAGYIGFIDKEFVLETLAISPKYCAALPEAYISATMDFVSCLKRLGYIKRDMLQTEIFDTSLIRQIHPEKDHYNPVV